MQTLVSWYVRPLRGTDQGNGARFQERVEPVGHGYFSLPSRQASANSKPAATACPYTAAKFGHKATLRRPGVSARDASGPS